MATVQSVLSGDACNRGDGWRTVFNDLTQIEVVIEIISRSDTTRSGSDTTRSGSDTTRSDLTQLEVI